MSELSHIEEINTERLLRVRGILIEEFDKYFAKAKANESPLDTMDILLDFEEKVFPSFDERLKKIYSKEKKLEILQANEEDSGDETEEET